MNLKILAHVLSKIIWQTSRYGFAIISTSCAIAILPTVLWFIAAVISGILVVLFSLWEFISGVTGSADPPIMAIILAVLVPIVYVIILVISLVVILISALLISGLIVLPASLVAELTLQYMPTHRFYLKIARFGIIGFIGGSIVNGIWLAFNLQHDLIITFLQMGVIVIICTLATTLFGSTLLATDKAREFASKIGAWFLGRSANANIPSA